MKVKESYNQWASTYDSDENKTRDLDKQVSQKTLRKYNFKTALELGCGTGKNTKWLQAHCQQLTGVDFSNEMIEIAIEKVKDPRVKFIQADITTNWDFIDTKVDLITCNLILEHIEDINFIFQQAASKLNPNGIFFISEYHPFKQYLGKQARFEKDGETIQIPSFVHHTSEFLKAGDDNGFRLLELKEWMDLDGDSELPRILSLVFGVCR